jgi:hypothetical protein
MSGAALSSNVKSGGELAHRTEKYFASSFQPGALDQFRPIHRPTSPRMADGFDNSPAIDSPSVAFGRLKLRVLNSLT